jgi:hypothetical protein
MSFVQEISPDFAAKSPVIFPEKGRIAAMSLHG